ncbi:hypothetical protein [uncultured Psychroserpens sp.]|uniref:hypothetical protein n=1 Tax=uncultured Psychroserpens sp. TaxID=255436 RepID=UPI002610B0C7|nr:hypothetical protein [uncultured Psychroserpens sp.]
MKFKCHKCDKETEFNKSDYVGFGSKQKLETVIKYETFPSMKTKEITINCSSCKEPNKITIKYYG